MRKIVSKTKYIMKKLYNLILILILIFLFKGLIVFFIFRLPYELFSNINVFDYKKEEDFKRSLIFKEIKNSDINDFLKNISEEISLKDVETFFQNLTEKLELSFIKDNDSKYLQIILTDCDGIIIFKFNYNNKLESIETNCNVPDNQIIKKYNYLIRKDKEIELLKKYKGIDKYEDINSLVNKIGVPDYINKVGSPSMLTNGIVFRSIFVYVLKSNEDVVEEINFNFDIWLYFKSILINKSHSIFDYLKNDYIEVDSEAFNQSYKKLGVKPV